MSTPNQNSPTQGPYKFPAWVEQALESSESLTQPWKDSLDGKVVDDANYDKGTDILVLETLYDQQCLFAAQGGTLAA